tara:strand:- start:1790 stop:2365 length:576 start_codon:yes stop_codon:yes gene_type:complete
MSDKEDLDLIESAIKQGNKRAYSQLMQKYRDLIYYTLLKKTGNEDLSKDLTIKTFGKAFKKLHQYTPKYSFSTWLGAIARNNFIDYFRKSKKNKTIFFEDMKNDSGQQVQIKDHSLDPEAILHSKQRYSMLKAIINSLDKKYRIIVKLRYFDELTYDEISKKLNIPKGTVKAQLYRARNQLFGLISGNTNF